MHRKILVVEDDQAIAHLVQMHLCDCGFQVSVSHNGIDAARLIERETFDLLVLDLSLPGIDGLELCRRTRSRPAYIPILMLTARSAEHDRITGLDIGADDYLAKPFSIRELQARVKAICRRSDALAAQVDRASPSTIRLGTLVIDTERREVTIEDKPVHLRAKEFALLSEFAMHPGKVYSRTALLESVWKYAHEGYRHTVNTHINRLRMKIEKDPARPSLIRTVHGVGYQLVPDPSLAASP